MKRSYIEPGEVHEVDAANLRRVARLLRPYRLALWGVLASIAAAAVLGLVPPILVKRVIDVAIPAGDVGMLAWLSAGMVVGPLLAGLVNVGQKYLAAVISERLMFDVRVDLMRHLHRQSLGYFVRLAPGEAISRVLNDVQGIGGTITGALLDFCEGVIVLSTTFALLLVLDWRLALLALVLLPAFVLPSKRVGERRKALKREAQRRAATLTGLLGETLSVSGTALRQVFRAEGAELARFEGTAREMMTYNLRQSLVGRWFKMLLALFEAVGPALVFGVGGALVIAGSLELGTIVAFVTLLHRLYSPASSLAGVRVELVMSYAYFDRIFAVLDHPPEIVSPEGPERPERVLGAIAFKGVTFTYPGATTPALEAIDLDIPAGARIGIVGASGSGKSTLVGLIGRLYDPSAGAITLDGIDLRRWDLDLLRDSIGYVTQDIYLFNASVADNLRYAKADATPADLEAACRLAQIHDRIASWPAGYETIVGDRGARFSGGERQRLALARVILKSPRVLIFDEATNALDSANEALIYTAIDGFLKGRTCIRIAHESHSLRDVDTIVTLEHGKRTPAPAP